MHEGEGSADVGWANIFKLQRHCIVAKLQLGVFHARPVLVALELAILNLKYVSYMAYRACRFTCLVDRHGNHTHVVLPHHLPEGGHGPGQRCLNTVR